MTRITLPAHLLDELEPGLPAYGVTIVDRTHEPWAVTFEGPKQGLRDMYYERWGSDDPMPDFDKEPK